MGTYTNHRVIRSKLSGKWVTVFKQEGAKSFITVKAVGANEQSLLFVDNNEGNEAIYSISLIDGNVSGPHYQDDSTDIDKLVVDIPVAL